MVNTRKLIYFSVFLSIYSAVSIILTGWFGAKDQVFGVLVALFFPFIGLRYYVYFFVYQAIIIITDFPKLAIITEGFGKLSLILDKDNPLLNWFFSNNFFATFVVIIIYFVEVYIWLPYISYRLLKKIGFYKRINSILGEVN